MSKQYKPEIHLFVIWELGRYAENDIILDIANNFDIVQTFSITWSPFMVNRNFARFYDTKLPSNSQKEVYAGRGEFKLIIVRDNHPNYDYRLTSKGQFLVNTKMFDAKAKYRELTGGGHKIHCTNDRAELMHDIVMLLGLSLDDFLEKYDKPDNESKDIALIQDLPGTIGWKSFDELFYVLNECNEYVVLRNSDNISLQYFHKNKGDVDLLVKDRNRCLYILGDLSCIGSDKKEDSRVSVDNKVILFELYESGQNLFDKKYEKHLFTNKILKENIFCLPSELEFYTLLYHALLFHKNLSDKHLGKITALIRELKIKIPYVSQKSLMSLLNAFFTKVKCNFIAPDDGDIYFNFPLLKGKSQVIKNKKRSSILRLYMRKLVQVRASEKPLKIIFLRSMNNELEIMFGFRFRYFRKEIKFFLGNRTKYPRQ